MPDPRIVPLTEYEQRLHLENCTRGFSDQFGYRLLTFDRRAATPLELLHFRAEITRSASFEAALRARLDETHPKDSSVVPARSVERWDGDLVLVSRHAAGRRLCDVLAEHCGPAFALKFIRQVVPTIAALADTSPRFAHGALNLDRIVMAHDGRMAVAEHPIGGALESLGWTAAQLANELGLLLPQGTPPDPFDGRVDAAQIGFTALSLLVGRRLNPSVYPAQIAKLLDESSKARGGDTWAASRLRSWLERALQLGPRPLESARDALQSLGELPENLDAQPDAAKDRQPAVASTAVSVPSPAPAMKPPAPPPPQPRPGPAMKAAIDKPEKATEPVRPKPDPKSDVVRPKPDAVMEEPAPRRRLSMRSLALVGVSCLALAEAVLLGRRYSLQPAATSMTTAVPAPASVPAAAPPAASASTPASDATPSPRVPPRDATVEKEQAPPTSPAPVVPERPASRSSAPAPAGAPRFGALTFVSPVDLQVFEGGKRIGSSGGSIALLEGVHTVDLVNEALAFRGRETVTIKPGEMTSRAIALPNGRVSINAVPWADVWIDNAPVGQTPLANLSIAAGEHQVTFRHPQLGELRQTAVVSAQGVTRLSANMQR